MFNISTKQILPFCEMQGKFISPNVQQSTSNFLGQRHQFAEPAERHRGADEDQEDTADAVDHGVMPLDPGEGAWHEGRNLRQDETFGFRGNPD